MFGEKGLKDLETPGVDGPRGEGGSKGAMGFVIMLAITEPAMTPQRPEFPKPILDFFAR
jgi:hypothetical protein